MKIYRLFVTSAALLLAVAVLAAVPARGGRTDRSVDDGRFLLVNVRIIDVLTGALSSPQEMLIEDGRIAAVAPSLGKVKRAERIDCGGGYALPGLFDCHAHMTEPASTGAREVQGKLRAFVEHGITHVRDVGGPIDAVSLMARRISSGEMVGPEIFYAGPLVEMPPLAHDDQNKDLPGFTVPVTSEADVDRLLEELSAKGACMVKTFNKITPELFRHLLAEAGRRSLRVVHDPGEPLFNWVPMDMALDMGVTSIEHAKSPWPAVLRDDLQKEHDALIGPKANAAAQAALQKKIFELGPGSVSPEKLTALADKMKAKGAYLCPTLNVLLNLDQLALEEVKANFNGKEVPPQVVQMIKAQTELIGRMSRLFVTEFAKAGVPMLVGQDGNDADATIKEMRHLEDCGLRTIDIIRGATIYPARWLGVDGRLGTLAVGKEADLVVVARNPLAEIANIDSAVLVVQKGRVVKR